MRHWIKALVGMCFGSIGDLRGRRLPSLEEHLSEIFELTAGRADDLEECIRSLSNRLCIEIEVIATRPAVDTDLETEFGNSALIAEMLYEPDLGKVLIYVPSHIREDHFLFFKFLLHEMSHLVAGHPIPIVNCKEKLWWPPRRLAQRVPVADLAHNESEADLRAEWFLLVGLTGCEIHDADKHTSAF